MFTLITARLSIIIVYDILTYTMDICYNILPHNKNAEMCLSLQILIYIKFCKHTFKHV